MGKNLSSGQMLTDDKPNYYAWIFTGTVLFSLVLWLFSIFYNGVDAVQFDIFAARCKDLFADFTNICGYSAERDVYRNTVNDAGAKAYPPLPYVFAYIFSRIIVSAEKVYNNAYVQPQFLVMFVLMIVFIVTAINSLITFQLQGSPILKFLCALAITFSGPMLFLIERANVLLFVILFCMVFCFWYDSESKIKREIALICLSLAFAIKISPCLFGILLLIDKRYKDAIKSGLYGIMLFLLPFFFFAGGLNNIPLLIANTNAFFTEWTHCDSMSLKAIIYGMLGLERFNFVSIANVGVVRVVAEHPSLDLAIQVLKIISQVFLLSSVFLGNKRWRQILAIGLILVFTAKVSALYTMLYVFPALILFLNDTEHEKRDIIYLFAFTLLCSVYFFSQRINFQLPIFILYVSMLLQGTICIISHFTHKTKE